MKKRFFLFYLVSLTIYLTVDAPKPAGASPYSLGGDKPHSHSVIDGQWNKRYSDQHPNRHYTRRATANLNVGPPRTVRLIYFLPNDRPYRAEVVQRMKDEILNIQAFYAEQMAAHGYGRRTFRIETDAQGEPMVHRFDGKHPDSHYRVHSTGFNVDNEVYQIFSDESVYLVLIDNSIEGVMQSGRLYGGLGGKVGKTGGNALVSDEFGFVTAAHELGHAFGLGHDFRDNTFIMSYGFEARMRLSACAAGRLSVHPYFNSRIPTEVGEPPTIELISPAFYPAGSTRASIRFKVKDSDGLHQLTLDVETKEEATGGGWELKMCRELGGKREAIVELDYDGVIPSDSFTSLSDPVRHGMLANVVDKDGDYKFVFFMLAEISPYHIATLPQAGDVGSVAFSPDGTILASGWGDWRNYVGAVELWDVSTRTHIATLPHTGEVDSVSFSPDGNTLASGTRATYTGTTMIELWDVATRTNFATLGGSPPVIFSPDGTTLASGWGNLWDVNTRQVIATLPHTGGVHSVAFSPDGATLAYGWGGRGEFLGDSWGDGGVELWDVNTRTHLATFPHTDWVRCVAFSPDGRILASETEGVSKRGVKLWDVATRTNFANLEYTLSPVDSVAFSPDGTILAAGGWDGTVELWDVATLIHLATLPHTGEVFSVAFSPDGTLLASGSGGLGDSVVELWDMTPLTAISVELTAEVDIPDPNLRTAIAAAIGVSPNSPIYRAHLRQLTDLYAQDTNIADLTGLEAATGLTTLELGDNNITDLSALKGLTQLTLLGLWGNNITDISPLAGLTDLTQLWLWQNNIADLLPLAGLTRLTELSLWGNNITDLSALKGLTQLTLLGLENNNITDISPLAGLTDLTQLWFWQNNITDLSALKGLTKLTSLWLEDNNITDISPLAENTGLGNGDEVDVRGNPLSDSSIHIHIPALQKRGVTVQFNNIVVQLVNIPDSNLRAAIETALDKTSGNTITTADMERLTHLEASNANISDLTGLEHATKLTRLWLGGEAVGNRFVNSSSVSDLSPLEGLIHLETLELWSTSVSDLSPLAGLTNLKYLGVIGNNISDISVLAGLTNLESLYLDNNPISDLSSLAELTNLTRVGLESTSISDISPLADLINLTWMRLRHTHITDLSPLVRNTGLGNGDEVYVNGNPLNYLSINTHIPTLRSRGVEVHADNLKLAYLLSVPAGINLIHVPLRVSAVDGVATTIDFISDLYDALGGVDAVNFLMTYDTATQEWLTYIGHTDRGTASDRTLTDAMGIIAGMKAPTSIRLTGTPLGNNGTATIRLNQGLNMVGLPLRDATINRVSDLLSLDGFRGGNVRVVRVTVNGDLKPVRRAGDPGDIAITGGQGFMLTAQRTATVTLAGEGWTNSSATAAPQILTRLPVTNTTPVVVLKGEIVDEAPGVYQTGYRVAVKNRSSHSAAVTRTSPDETEYRLAIVDIETAQAARVGDTLEISAQSTHPFIGVKPLRYTVTAKDVSQGWIQLPALVAYEIPQETELLANYPNPFNPETWIPYRLAEDALVTLTIYDRRGRAVRRIDVGHRIAAVYESRDKAIYWDGRNNLGKQIASGVYFYHLDAGDYSQTRRMVIVK